MLRAQTLPNGPVRILVGSAPGGGTATSNGCYDLMLSLAEVIDPSKLSGAIKFGATVTIVDEDSDEEKTYQIVGEAEADIERGLLNIRSPIARALIGKEEGDSVEVKTPGGIKSYEILSIRYL